MFKRLNRANLGQIDLREQEVLEGRRLRAGSQAWQQQAWERPSSSPPCHAASWRPRCRFWAEAGEAGRGGPNV